MKPTEKTSAIEQADLSQKRGTCPECGDALVSNWYYTDKRGYVCFWECAASLLALDNGSGPTCTYRRVK